jgi:DNA-binding NtrC family response regulator
MRSGADHFLTKPVNMAELEVFLRKSLELGALRRENLSSKRLRKADQPYFGESQAMKKILDLATLGAESESPILLYGETGTGKGVLAKWIHEHSPRGKAQFVEINCTSLKGELLASELFGHSKGAFTSAVNDKQGLIEVADEGTLFLDEIGDMDPTVQSQFLKVIEEKQFRRLGEVKTRRSEFRLICATHKTLLEETEKGRFRKDLFFRINVFPIHLPTLKERPEDLPGFVEYFLRQSVKNQTEIRPDVLALLSDYGWPGNVRELRNVLERAALLSRGGTIGTEHFPGLEAESAAERSDTRESSPATTDLEKVEELHVISVLNRFDGDTKKAAEALGISRAALYRKLEKYKNQSK